MKIFITGLSGFVGANLALRLAKSGEEVHGLVLRTSKLWRLASASSIINFHYGDLRDGEDIKKIIKNIRPDIIYHLGVYGAYHYQTDAASIFRTCMEGTFSVLEAASEAGVKMVINTGSSSEYGKKDHPMRENGILEPNSYYAVSKAAQTLLCQHFARERGLPTITLRLFSVYGQYEEPGRLVPTAIIKALSGENIPLANPDTARDFIYIDDVIDAIIAAAQRTDLSGHIFNVGTGKYRKLKDVIKHVLKKTNSNVKPLWHTYESRPFDTGLWVADTAKTQKLLGIRAKYTLEEGIERTTEWIKDNAHLYHGNK